MNFILRNTVVAGLMGLAASSGVHAQYAKLDAALSDLLDKSGGRLMAPANARGARVQIQSNVLSTAQMDSAGRVLVDMVLDGSTDLDSFVKSLEAAGASITGVNPYFRNGAVSAYLPVNQLGAVSATRGLHVMKMTARPQANVGLTTSGGVKTIRSDVANASGFIGAGITVGVLSDSYNTSPTSFTTIRAANDIASGDLPTPKLVIDFTASTSNTDEGRAMMQIVHDVAPGADLCFATADFGEASFAANIRALRTNPACNADVIVDDVFYFDEPFFSDGQVAQAVDDVSNSTTLAGKKVAYFSSAGNQGSRGGGGSIDIPVANFSTSPTGLGNINLATVSTCTSSPSAGSTKADVGGGWLDFGGGNYFATLTLTTSGTMIMQWDDPFYAGAVTTDLNFFLFNSSGSCVLAFAANNFTTDRGYEQIGVNGSGTFRVMISRTSAGSKLASRVRLVNLGGWSGGPLAVSTNPTTFGHSAAASANSVSAYVYTNTLAAIVPVIESFTSLGPVTIAFDAAGNRLPVAETRKKPDIAAPDGGNTTFFYPGSDYEGDGFPNFFGTSAAAPHAAGVAALLLQKAGGPNSLTPKQVKSILQTTAPARVLPFGVAPAVKGWNVYDGFGLIDAVNALNKLP